MRFPCSHRREYKDKALKASMANSDWSNLQLVRFVAVKKRFTNISFANTTFDASYLRDSQFDSCNFSGARFTSTRSRISAGVAAANPACSGPA